MALSKQEIEHYHEAGYVIPDYRLPEETLESIRADYDRLLARHPEFHDYCPMLLRYDLSFLNYARDPNILNMVEQVIGSDVILWNSSFFAKPAENGKKTRRSARPCGRKQGSPSLMVLGQSWSSSRTSSRTTTLYQTSSRWP